MRGVSNHMKNKKAIAKMILLAFILSIVLPAGAFAEGTTASDISGHWAESTITNWMDDGLIGGYSDGTFQPDKAITRAEFIKLVNAATNATTVGTVDFTDVTSDDWFYGELGDVYKRQVFKVVKKGEVTRGRRVAIQIGGVLLALAAAAVFLLLVGLNPLSV